MSIGFPEIDLFPWPDRSEARACLEVCLWGFEELTSGFRDLLCKILQLRYCVVVLGLYYNNLLYENYNGVIKINISKHLAFVNGKSLKLGSAKNLEGA